MILMENNLQPPHGPHGIEHPYGPGSFGAMPRGPMQPPRESLPPHAQQQPQQQHPALRVSQLFA
jgi:hypothetical protein